jgi:Flp pilus assembly protein TadG
MPIKLLKKYRNDEKGTTAVEFALIAIVFLSMIFGIFESARVFWALNTLQYAVEQGTRFALVNPNATQADITAVVLSNMNGIATTDTNPNVSVNPALAVGDVTFVVVDASYRFTLLMPFIPETWNELDLDASSRLAVPD